MEAGNAGDKLPATTLPVRHRLPLHPPERPVIHHTIGVPLHLTFARRSGRWYYRWCQVVTPGSLSVLTGWILHVPPHFLWW